MRDYTMGDSEPEGKQTWFEAANGIPTRQNIWTDASGRIHSGP